MLSVDECRELAAAFTEHRYTVDAVVAGIGEEAHRALGRNSTIPAVRALAGHDDPLATLTRLWPLQQPVARAALDRALPGLLEPLIEAKILAATGEQVRAETDVRPYASDDGDFWVVSDLSPNLDTAVAPMRPDLVLGLSAASTSLAQLTIRRPVGRGAPRPGYRLRRAEPAPGPAQRGGGGHRPEPAGPGPGPAATAMLNGIDLDLREGSLYAPVAGERFDLITSNPPYVMSPPTGASRLTYREGDIPADGLVEQVVHRARAEAEQERADAGVERRGADPRRRAPRGGTRDQPEHGEAAERRLRSRATGATMARPSVVLCSAKPTTRKAPRASAPAAYAEPMATPSPRLCRPMPTATSSARWLPDPPLAEPRAL